MSFYNSQLYIRLVVCMGRHCNANGKAEPLYERLRAELGEPADFRTRKPIRWERASCLGQCDIGPNCVFYPDGIWFHQLTPADLDEVINIFREEESRFDE
jgi:(2Fe-2S) ferredoxin